MKTEDIADNRLGYPLPSTPAFLVGQLHQAR